MYNNDEYRRALLTIQEDFPIFFQDWWMDAVCGENNWRGFVVKSGNFVKAVCPLMIQNRKFGRIHYTMPHFTPFNGVLYNYPPEQKYCTKLAYEKDVISELLTKIGKFDNFSQKFIPEFTNWLPYYWNDFKQTTVYTYRVHNLKDQGAIFDNFQQNVRREIRRAEKRGVVIESIEDVDTFYKTVIKTYKRQGKNINYSLNELRRLDEACTQHECRQMFAAKDPEGNIHCVIYLVWDKQNMYYLLGGGDPELRTSGATSMLIYHSLIFASTKVECFDFEGSVIEPVERFFRGFDARQYPVMCICKQSKKENLFQALLKIIALLRK